MLGIGNYFWRLMPANPILIRVVSIAGKRKRDLAARCLYLGLMIGVVVIAIAFGNSTGSTSLDQLAIASEDIFYYTSFLQLGLVALLAPIFTAGAITQEKDSQTYDILLATPLTNGQIVLGTLLSRLFFIVALLMSGVPVFAITQIFGGVAINDIVISCSIAVATACVTGALAVAIATFKVGTRRTIFSFYMLVVVYLAGGYVLDRLPFFHIPLIDPSSGLPSSELSQTSWLASIHPFLALSSLFSGYRAPDVTQLPAYLRVWPLDWAMTHPSTFYPTLMLILSFVMVFPSVVFLRRMAQSTLSMKQVVGRIIPIKAITRGRKVRTVWINPIAWREARTKASAARASLMRYVFMLCGIAGALTIWWLYTSEPTTGIKNLIESGCYSSTAHTLFIKGDNLNMAVSQDVVINIDGKDVAPQNGDEALSGRYEVNSFTQRTLRTGAKAITRINLRTIPGQITRAQAHQFLLGAILVEVSILILIVSNAAASTVTREREDGTLDLLLTTPITSKTYMWGKLIGLVGFMLPLISVPVISAAIFVINDLYHWVGRGESNMQWLVLPEAILLLPFVLVTVVAFATVIGMQMSLRNRTTVRAVMSSLGIVVGAISAMGWCGYTAANSSNMGDATMAILGFSPLSVIALLIDSTHFGGEMGHDGLLGTFDSPRIILFIFTLIATSAYAAMIYWMYRSMVKNFDMTIRRQSR